MAWLWLMLSQSGDGDYKQARVSEKMGDWKKACYEYASAILKGSTGGWSAWRRMKRIWRDHGPFDYSDVLESFLAEGFPRKGSRVGFHEDIVELFEGVEKRVAAKRKQR